jgi:hypothetical protein
MPVLAESRVMRLAKQPRSTRSFPENLHVGPKLQLLLFQCGPLSQGNFTKWAHQRIRRMALLVYSYGLICLLTTMAADPNLIAGDIPGELQLLGINHIPPRVAGFYQQIYATLTQARQVIVAKPPQLPSTFHCGDRVVI